MCAEYIGGLHEIAPSTYAYLQPNGSWGWSNAGLIRDGEEALLVDTLFTVELTRRMLATIERALPALDIRLVVNTHGDGDHWWGNQLVSGSTIIASAAAVREMRHAGPAGFTSALEAGKADPRFAELAKLFADFDFRDIAPTYPAIAFAGELEVSVGARTVRLIEVGPAHTEGDVLVHVPDQRVLFTGDILFIGGHPVVHSGPVDRWIEACDLILDLDVKTIVPGHGPVVGKAEVAHFRDYLTRVRDHAVAAHGRGSTVIEATREFDLDGFADLDDNGRLLLNIGAVYRELNGDGTPDERELMPIMHELTRHYETR
ncbi:MBL fold metallo-hydrolase [Nocardia panacis]|uniref:MBL fold metallo-hydrolase n=1 Tax=Nocardia panacis TaxID=2340916 RepID=A0A3A4KMP1_9NOCA|nr:MBL fold metallo-hydrolase [Nocardia panacis]RJO70806.1 MBL fold metallo-hydrolase [Nocardia panacis]